MSLNAESHAEHAVPEKLVSQLQALIVRVGALESKIQQGSDDLRVQLGTVLEALELLHDDDPRARRALRRLRAEPGYQEAFASPNPLVSVVIPTWQSVDTLIDRAIPSALSQTHPNIEVVVVGDASPPVTAEAIAALDDPRVVFHNLTLRGPYHEDPSRSWAASGTPGFNAGVALARGHWIAPLGDDDAFVPEHVERLLETARDRRLEFIYGRIRMIMPDGSESLLGEFPPRLTQIGLQAALYHRGLSFMELELGHAIFGKPNDWGLVHRMMRAGVRMGMVDEVSVIYWPSLRAHPDHQSDDDAPTSAAAADEQVDQRVAELEGQVSDLDRRLVEEQARSSAVDAQVGDLERRLEEVRQSRSWRLTAPLRRLRNRS
jgi:hypothetical protein